MCGITHLSFEILSYFHYVILLPYLQFSIFDMQFLIGFVFCNKKVKVRHGTVFLLILGEKIERLEGVLNFF